MFKCQFRNPTHTGKFDFIVKKNNKTEETQTEEIKSSTHIYSHPCAQNKECSFSVKIVIFEIGVKDVYEKSFASLFVQGSHSTGFEPDLSNLEMCYETEQFIKSNLVN